MPNVTLVGGPRDADVVTVGEPWPRHSITVDDLAGSSATYIVRDAALIADFYDQDAVVDETEATEIIRGPQGIPGAVGPPGPPGEQGETGLTGSPLNPRGAWDPAAFYVLWDTVTYDDGTYMMVANGSINDPPPDPAYWMLLGAVGPVGPQGDQGIQGEPGSPLPVRETQQIVTAALAQGAVENGDVELAVGYRVLRVETDKAAWVRLYTTAGKRGADAARNTTEDIDPATDHGLVVEVTTAPGALGFDLSPVPQGYSMEAVPSAMIPYSVTNLDPVGGPVTVTLTWQEQEA